MDDYDVSLGIHKNIIVKTSGFAARMSQLAPLCSKYMQLGPGWLVGC